MCEGFGNIVVGVGILLLLGMPRSAAAIDLLSNPLWNITIWDSGYSDYMVSPYGHEQLSGDWAAAILYDGIGAPNGATDEAMWLEPMWVCPDWASNSAFTVVSPFVAWDDPGNPIEGNDTGQGVVTNGQVEITIDCTMLPGRTVAGLSPGVAGLTHILTYYYVMVETYTIRNVGSTPLTNLAWFQFMHAHPNDNYDAVNFGVYDPTPYVEPEDAFPAWHYDMTFFSPDAVWATAMDDIVGFCAERAPDAWGIGEFPSVGCGGGEPGPSSLHHLVEANALFNDTVFGPAETAGAMRWSLGTLAPGQSISHAVLFYTAHSAAGLPPTVALLRLDPATAQNPLNSSHTVTATATIDGVPQPGVSVLFRILSGPNQSLTHAGLTDSVGQATFTYTGLNAGWDRIIVQGDVDGDGNNEVSNVAVKQWGEEFSTATPTPITTPHEDTPTPSWTVTPTASCDDTDRDRIDDCREGENLSLGEGQSNRWLHDSDGDGLPDGEEDSNRNGYRDADETSTRQRDSDGDGAWDGMEENVLHTDPLDGGDPASYVDMDEDGYPIPYDELDGDPDQDGDRITDGYEAAVLDRGAVRKSDETPELGDLNLDKFRSNLDGLMVQALFLSVVVPSDPVFAERGFSNGDVNRDGRLTNLDGLIIQSFFLNLTPRLPL